MKMVKSRTRKKFVKKPKPASQDPLDIISTATTQYIKQWTERELGKLQDQRDASVCIPTKTGYRIGLYTLKVNPNRTCELRNHYHELIHVFENRVSAILYTIYTIKHRYWAADEIIRLDREINKLYTDVINYRRVIDHARQNRNYDTVDSRQNRLEIAEQLLSVAREKVADIHQRAKVDKVWL